MDGGDRWATMQRLEGWVGEIRLNFIRVAAILGFYAHHLINVYLIQDDPSLRGTYHIQVTALSVAWALSAMVLHFALARRWIPPWLKFAETAWDAALITALGILSGGPGTPFVVLYFLVIAASGLRLSLRLVWCSTLGCMAAYVVLLGYAKFYVPQQAVPRTEQIILLIAMGAAGLLAGQSVRQARRIAEGYPVEVEPVEEKSE